MASSERAVLPAVATGRRGIGGGGGAVFLEPLSSDLRKAEAGDSESREDKI